MLALLILLLIPAVGYLLIESLSLKIPSVVQIAAGWVTGVIILGWLSLLLIAGLGFQFGLWLSVLALAVASSYLFLKHKPKWRVYPSQSARISLAALIIFWGVIFGWLFHTHMFQIKDDGWYSSGSAWGDMALHAAFINEFASQTTLDLTSPIYAQMQTNYPFLVDFTTALIFRSGFSLQQSLVIFGVLTTLATIILMFHLAWQITGKYITGWFFSVLFLTNGGIGAYYFWQDWQKSGQAFFEFLTNLELNYANLFDRGIYWTNVTVDALLPQRGFLFGLAIFSLVIFIWHQWWTKPSQQKILVFSCILVGLTPLFHVHTFIALWGTLVWLLIFGWWSHRLTFKHAISNLLIASFLALPQFLWMTTHTTHTDYLSFFSWQLGWMAGDEPLTRFWLRNMGLGFIVLIFGSIYFFWQVKKYQFVKVMLAPLLVLFVISNLVLFQPYEYDNIKLMLLSYWAVMLMLSILLTEWWQQKKYWLVVLIILVMIPSGALAITRETYQSWQIASNEEVAVAEKVKQLTPAGSIFLTAENHNHLVPMLAGRPTVQGYPGWLWTHGFDYTQTERDVRLIYEGDENALHLIDQYNIDYIFVGPSEHRQFNVNEEFLKKNFSEIQISPAYKAYKINF